MVISTSNTYTPVAEDRDGITLRCNDTEHSKWRVQDDIIKYMDVEPKCKLITIVMWITPIQCVLLFIFLTAYLSNNLQYLQK